MRWCYLVVMVLGCSNKAIKPVSINGSSLFQKLKVNYLRVYYIVFWIYMTNDSKEVRKRTKKNGPTLNILEIKSFHKIVSKLINY